MSRRRPSRARKIASGSTTAIWSPMKLSDGSNTASATNARSSSGSRSVPAMAAITASVSARCCPAAATSVSSINCCNASYRANGSSSCAPRNARSAALRSVSRIAGAENPRLIDRIGRSASPSNTTRCSVSVSRIVCSSPWLRAVSAPNSFMRKGRTTGRFSAWPGVGGVRCASTSSARPEPASCSSDAVTRGVPAWPYQRRNCRKSMPLASSSDATKSSQVAAVPSKRSKYRSHPARNACGPRIVASMRMISAPLL